jgi:hypothetical protein
MSTIEEKTEVLATIGSTCCGGPASEGIAACCRPTGKVMAEKKVMATDDLTTEVIEHDRIRHTVRQQYGQIAEKGGCGCGGGECCGTSLATPDSLSEKLGDTVDEVQMCQKEQTWVWGAETHRPWLP